MKIPRAAAVVPAALFALTAFPATALAAGEDPVLPLLLDLVVILVSARLMGHLATVLGQPSVLGELIAGILIGNAVLLGFGGLERIKTDTFIDMLARLGVAVLLFEVGLESTVRDMLKVGLSSLLVAVLGVAAPFALGWLVGAWLLPDRSVYVHAFLGATLSATSVGITARVLQDLGRSKSREARIILGAAVIDDVLGLIVLASVSGMILAADVGKTLSLSSQAAIPLKAALFLAGALFLGTLFTPRIFRTAARLRGPGVLLGLSLSFCFLLAWLSGQAGLAPIVGAFAAGLILEPVHFRSFGERGIHRLEEGLKPLTEFLVPIFFVQMGARVDLRVFASADALWLSAALTAAAIIGKQVCSLGVIGKGINRWAVGFGMIPRGEVGLIFVGIGSALTLFGERIIDDTAYSAVVIMVIVTTLVSPPLLKMSMAGRRRAGDAAGEGGDAHSGP